MKMISKPENYDSLSAEHKEIYDWLSNVKFCKARFGGLEKSDVWSKLGSLDCGRVVANGGDNIGFSDNKLFVNGTAQTTSILFPATAPEGWSGTVTIPDNAVYILGDFRTQSQDSRVFGTIPLENIKSKVIVLLRHKTL